MGFFKPGYMSKNPKTRLAAIEKTNDVSVLKQLATQDADCAVQERAKHKYTEVVLQLNQDPVIAACFDVIGDEQFFLDIICDKNVRFNAKKIAFAKLRREDSYATIAMSKSLGNGSVIRRMAMERITNTDKLKQALKQYPFDATESTVSRITDEETLKSVIDGAWMFLEPKVLSAAVQNIHDQAWLSEMICKCENHHEERAKVFADALFDKSALEHAYQSSQINARRLIAVKLASLRCVEINEIRDQAMLSEIAQNDQFLEARLAAIEKLENEPMLSEIALNNEFLKARLAAIEKLENEQVLKRIAIGKGIAHGHCFYSDDIEEMMIAAVNRLKSPDVIPSLLAEPLFFNNSVSYILPIMKRMMKIAYPSVQTDLDIRVVAYALKGVCDERDSIKEWNAHVDFITDVAKRYPKILMPFRETLKKKIEDCEITEFSMCGSGDDAWQMYHEPVFVGRSFPYLDDEYQP